MADSTTFSRKPVVALTLPDANGIRAEVLVASGYGNVTNIQENKKNARVVFSVSNTKFDTIGFVAMDSDVFKEVKKAYDERTPIYYRVEIVRKPGVDPTIPIAELRKNAETARDSVFKQLTAVKVTEDSEWIITDNISTLIEDTEYHPQGRPINPYSLSEEERREMLGQKAAPRTEAYPANNGHEAPSYKKTNSDGTLNPGSNWVLAASSALCMAHELNTENKLELTHEEIQELATQFYRMATWLQVNIYKELGVEFEADASAGSHIRARGFINQSLRANPISPNGFKEPKARKLWLKQVRDESFEAWKFCLSVISEL